MTPYESALLNANREAMHRDAAGRPLPTGQRRRLSMTESYAIAESVRQRDGFGKSSGAGFGEAARPRPAPGSVAESHPEWLEEGFVAGIVAEVAARTAGVVALETDPQRLSQMSTETFREHTAAVTETAEMAIAPLPPARLTDAKKLSEMSDAEFKAYSIGLHSAPSRLTPPPNRRVNEAVDVDKLTEVLESAPSTAEEHGDTFRSVYEAIGRPLKSPFWRS